MSHRASIVATLALPTLLTLILSACSLGITASEPNLSPVAAADPAATADRTDCNSILGTAFRSSAERDWFLQNCGQWPPIQVPDSPVASAPAVAPEVQARCDAQRGKPYANADARTWYLQNCNNLPPTTNVSASAPASTDATNVGPDRTSCDEIRGTSYRSANEQRWYQQNCGANGQNPPSQQQQANGQQPATAPVQQPAASSGGATQNAVSSSCAAIASAGGPRNAVEREFYLRYCR